LAPLLTRRQEAQIHALFALEFESNHARRMSVPSMSVSAIDIRRQFTTYFFDTLSFNGFASVRRFLNLCLGI
jgi:hypothetical protein